MKQYGDVFVLLVVSNFLTQVSILMVESGHKHMRMVGMNEHLYTRIHHTVSISIHMT